MKSLSPNAGSRVSRGRRGATVARHALYGALAALLVIAGPGCAMRPGTDAAPVAELAWPPPPEAPRIVLRQIITGPADLGIGMPLLGRLKGLFVGPTDITIDRPMGVLIDQAGRMFVADPGREGVHLFDAARDRYRLLRRRDQVPMPSPVGLAAGPAGTIYVTDSRLGEVFVLYPDEEVLIPLALDEELNQPTGIAFDADKDRLYIADTASHAVKVFTSRGRLVGEFGRRGAGPREFNYPTLVWRNREGNLLVNDSLNHRIQIFAPLGRQWRSLGTHGDGTGDLARSKGVATDRAGHIYVVDALFHAFQIFDAAGEFLLSVGTPGQAAGEFWLPTGIFIDTLDRIYVCDSFNSRIQVFQYMDASP